MKWRVVCIAKIMLSLLLNFWDYYYSGSVWVEVVEVVAFFFELTFKCSCIANTTTTKTQHRKRAPNTDASVVDCFTVVISFSGIGPWQSICQLCDLSGIVNNHCFLLSSIYLYNATNYWLIDWLLKSLYSLSCDETWFWTKLTYFDICSTNALNLYIIQININNKY